MSTSALTSLTRPEVAAAPRSRLTVPRPGTFDATLRRAAAAPRDPLAEAREAAQMLVATALVQPILAQARESSMGVEPFAPGPAERRFGTLLDQHLADRLVQATRFPLVDELARRMSARTSAGLDALRDRRPSQGDLA